MIVAALHSTAFWVARVSGEGTRPSLEKACLEETSLTLPNLVGIADFSAAHARSP